MASFPAPPAFSADQNASVMSRLSSFLPAIKTANDALAAAPAGGQDCFKVVQVQVQAKDCDGEDEEPEELEDEGEMILFEMALPAGGVIDEKTGMLRFDGDSSMLDNTTIAKKEAAQAALEDVDSESEDEKAPTPAKTDAVKRLIESPAGSPVKKTKAKPLIEVVD